MAEGDLQAADALVSAAEKLNVKYNGFLHLGDTPKKARADLQRKLGAADSSPIRPSQIFSRLVPRKEQPPRTDPFAGRSDQSLPAALSDRKGLAKSFILRGRKELAVGNPAGAAHWYRMAVKEPVTFGPAEDSPAKLAADVRRAGGRVDQPVTAAGLGGPLQNGPMPPLGFNDPMPPAAGSSSPRLQSPFSTPPVTAPGQERGSQASTTLSFSGGPAGMSMATDAGQSNPLLQARRALAVGDLRRAADLVKRAAAENRRYQPLDDTPEKVKAAILKYQDLASRPKDSQAYRRGYARMLMEQSQALLAAGDVDQAERLANSASDWATRHRLIYGPFETKPDDVLKQILNARRQRSPSSSLAAPSPSPGMPGASLAARKRSDDLVRQARSALSSGQLDRAESLARQAEQLGAPSSTYAPGEDRPGLVLFDVRRRRGQAPSGVVAASARSVVPATGSVPAKQSASAALYNSLQDSTRNVRAGFQAPGSLTIPQRLDLAQNASPPSPPSPPSMVPDRPPVSAPPVAVDPSASGLSLFQQGEAALKAHDENRAYQLFLQANRRSNDLDPVTRQRLQSYLQLLSPLTAGPPPGGRPRSAIDDAVARRHVLARQVSAELAGQEAKARALLQSDPKGALALLEDARRQVEASGLEAGDRQQLLMRVDRHIRQTQQFIEHNRPRIELDQKNQQTRDRIERTQRVKLETQDKLALMVNDFNRKMDEERFDEADVVAKRAAELDPNNPIVRQLLLRSKDVRRYIQNLRLKDSKENSFWETMDSVAKSGEPFDDRFPIRFPKGWKELSDLRSRMLQERGERRTEREIEIEQKLKTPVSLQFESEPLANVLDYLQKLTEVNMHLDPEGLAEYGVTSDTPVTIKVQHDIMLKSALNLILEPLHLTYVIKDEVLKITTEQQREGEVFTKTYSVADLVVPVPNFIASPRMGLAGAYHDAMGNIGFGGGSPFGTSTTPLAVVATKDGSQNSGMINPGILAQMSAGGPRSGVTNMPLGFGPGGLGGGSQADFDSLIELITSTIQPTTWDEVGGAGSIAPFDTNLSLVVSQTQDVHEEIVDLLAQLRRLQDLQVTIEVRFITLNDNFFERMGVDFDFDVDDDIDRPFMVFGRPDETTPGDPVTGTEPTRNTLDVDHDRSVTVGMQSPGVFSADLDIPFTQNSFGLAVPQFGGFDASAGATIGFAILSDIEAFFFINAAQGDRRSNVLQAPKVTLFNGQQAFVSDTSQSPFVISVVPVVGDFAAAQQPVIVVLSEGTLMTVQAVVSQDRRFVRLTVVPFFSKIGKVDKFQFTGSETTTTDTTSDGVLDPDNADPNSAIGSSNNTTVSRNGTTVQLPTFSFVTVTTTVSVPDGGTVLLGGIKRLSEGRNEFGVPILNKIPYVNRLFKNVGIGRETQSLMMMVTPRIIIQEEEEERLGI